MWYFQKFYKIFYPNYWSSVAGCGAFGEMRKKFKHVRGARSDRFLPDHMIYRDINPFSVL